MRIERFFYYLCFALLCFAVLMPNLLYGICMYGKYMCVHGVIDDIHDQIRCIALGWDYSHK